MQLKRLYFMKSGRRQFGSELFSLLKERGVELRGDKKALAIDSSIALASEEDWETEFLSLTLAVKVVSTVEEAIHHINTYGSMHSEAIITENEENVSKFFTSVDRREHFIIMHRLVLRMDLNSDLAQKLASVRKSYT